MLRRRLTRLLPFITPHRQTLFFFELFRPENFFQKIERGRQSIKRQKGHLILILEAEFRTQQSHDHRDDDIVDVVPLQHQQHRNRREKQKKRKNLLRFFAVQRRVAQHQQADPGVAGEIQIIRFSVLDCQAGELRVEIGAVGGQRPSPHVHGDASHYVK